MRETLFAAARSALFFGRRKRRLLLHLFEELLGQLVDEGVVNLVPGFHGAYTSLGYSIRG
jgi:hypothetical protein